MTAKRASLKVTPTPALHVQTSTDECAPLPLVRGGAPLVVLGNERVPALISEPVLPSASTLFGPRGACLLGDDGPLWVCDTGHHRMLGWKKLPKSDGVPADFVIGQLDFESEGRNGHRDVGASTLNVPTGVCSTGKGFAVADAWNHRVLIWHEVPTANNQPADVVLGQADFFGGDPNRGVDVPFAASLHWPYGVSYDAASGKFVVCDTGNRRTLIWNSLPERNGQEADCVLGQVDFSRRDENAGDSPTAGSMRWPHAAVFWQGRLCITDAGNNRVLQWNSCPEESGAKADLILGQSDEHSVDHNKALYWPRDCSLNMPYGVTTFGDWLVIADTANSRILGWSAEGIATTRGASALLGQPDFHSKGDNRWQPPCADSLCWPYAVQSLGRHLVVSDSGNNRVSIWEFAL